MEWKTGGRVVRYTTLGCNLLCMACMAVAMATSEWLTWRPVAPVNFDDARVSRVGLREFSIVGKCYSDECRSNWRADEARAVETCERGTWAQGTSSRRCSYHRKGYCTCPYPGEKRYIARTPKGSCKTGDPNVAEEDAIFYAETVHEKRSIAFGCLIAALVFGGISTFSALSVARRDASMYTNKSARELYKAMFCQIPELVLLIVSLVFGRQYTRLHFLTPTCGSLEAWEGINQTVMPEGERIEVNFFALGPIMCLLGVAALVIPWVAVSVLYYLQTRADAIRPSDGDEITVQPAGIPLAPGGASRPSDGDEITVQPAEGAPESKLAAGEEEIGG